MMRATMFQVLAVALVAIAASACPARAEVRLDGYAGDKNNSPPPPHAGPVQDLFRGDLTPEAGVGCTNGAGTLGGPNDVAVGVTATVTPPIFIDCHYYNIFTQVSPNISQLDFVVWGGGAVPGPELDRVSIAPHWGAGDHTVAVGVVVNSAQFYFGHNQNQTNVGMRWGVDTSSGSAGTSFIRAPTCGLGTFELIDNIGFPGNLVMSVSAEGSVPLELNASSARGGCGSFGRLEGRVWEDLDSDCTQNGESDLENQRVLLQPGARVATTRSDGTYRFNVIPGTYTLTLISRTNWLQSCPPAGGAHVVTVAAQQTIGSLDFGTEVDPTIQDLSIFHASSGPRPGSDPTYWVEYLNSGGITLAGTVTLQLPSVLIYIDSTPSGTYNPVLNTVTWNTPTLAPGDSGQLRARGTVPQNTSLGTFLLSSAEIQPMAGDANTLDNVDTEWREVRGSYDPNQKGVEPEPAIPEGEILRYHVDFQNVGTAEAIDVVVRDTLDANLDIATVQFGTTSHASVAQIEDRTLVWTFAGINLPDSTSNEPESHGYAEFTVYPLPGLDPGTEIRNDAAIYFDFNEPVITNEVMTFILGPSGVLDATSTASSLRIESIEPNPSRAGFSIRFRAEELGLITADVHDASGRLVRRLETQVNARAGGSPQVNWDGTATDGRRVETGVYYLRAQQAGARGEKLASGRLVVVR